MAGRHSATLSQPMLIVGLGNPLLGDDGVGWRVAEQVQHDISSVGCAVEVDCLAIGGLRLMERLTGYSQVILIDAMTTGLRPVGSVQVVSLTQLPDLCAGHLNSSHDTSLQTALRMGRALGIPLPDKIRIVGVEAERVFDFTEDLTPSVAAAVPLAAQMILTMLQQPVVEE
ncbi:MAG: hydrogenase maturation protease [Anaerolineae bacterium]|nr:hydrogenase maturation protease [Anaerolineae bacterium]